MFSLPPFLPEGNFRRELLQSVIPRENPESSTQALMELELPPRTLCQSVLQELCRFFRGGETELLSPGK